MHITEAIAKGKISALIAGALILAGCQAMNGLVFHPIHKVWADHKSNEEATRAPKNYVQELELKAASEEYMRTNSLTHIGYPVVDTPESRIDRAMVESVRRREGTNFIGVYLGMVALAYDGPIWPSTNISHSVMMYSATSGQMIRWIERGEFNAVYVDKTKPEYPAQ